MVCFVETAVKWHNDCAVDHQYTTVLYHSTVTSKWLKITYSTTCTTSQALSTMAEEQQCNTAQT